MRIVLRHVITSAALVAGLAVSGGSRAQAGVSFSGTFPLPHGQISIGIGDPYFQVGAYVPAGFQIYARTGYGYGFAYNNNWIPVRPYGDAWQVCGRPYFDDVYYPVVYYDAYYGGGYGGYYGGYYARPSHRYANRGYYPRNDWHHDYAPYDRRDHNGGGHYNRNGHDNANGGHHGNGHHGGGHDRGGDGGHRENGHGGNRHGENHRH
jgi:hypothetical protein